MKRPNRRGLCLKEHCGIEKIDVIRLGVFRGEREEEKEEEGKEARRRRRICDL